MGSEMDLIKDNYSKNFKANEYVNSLEENYRNSPHHIQDPLTFIHTILQSGKFKGSKLLDIGSGPVVHNIASASAFYSNIIMADYVEDNCEQLKCWLQGRSNIQQFLDFAAELEGYVGNLEVGKQLLEKRIKKCVKQVVRCDILTENIFMEEVIPEVAPPYDLIISSWCLDAVSPDLDNYLLILKRINKLLRPGGGLILIGDFDQENWKVGEKEFHNLHITASDLMKTMKESEFKFVDMKITYYKDSDNGTVNMHETSNSKADYYSLAVEKL